MRVAVRCEDRGVAVRVLDLAQQDLQRGPHPDEPDEGAPDFVSRATPVVGGAECWVDVKGDPLLEDLFLQYVHARAAAAGLSRDAVVEAAGTSGEERSQLLPAALQGGPEAPGPGGQEAASLRWPDGSNG